VIRAVKPAVSPGSAARDYSLGELMVAAASREVADAEMVFVGMRLPVLAYAVARNAHAPNARGLFEVGLMRDQPAAGGWKDRPRNSSGAAQPAGPGDG